MTSAEPRLFQKQATISRPSASRRNARLGRNGSGKSKPRGPRRARRCAKNPTGGRCRFAGWQVSGSAIRDPVSTLGLNHGSHGYSRLDSSINGRRRVVRVRQKSAEIRFAKPRPNEDPTSRIFVSFAVQSVWRFGPEFTAVIPISEVSNPLSRPGCFLACCGWRPPRKISSHG